MALTTASRVRQRLGIVSDGVNGINDPEIDSLIVEMTAALQGWCGVARFESGAYDEIHDGGNQTISLKANYADAVATVSTIDDGGTERPYPSSLWRLDKSSALLIHSRSSPFYGSYEGCFPSGIRNIRVQATAGYLAVPGDLQFVATELVKEALLDRLNTLRNAQFNQSGTTVQRRSWPELIAEHEWKISRWRRFEP
jgi:hypothetical protein